MTWILPWPNTYAARLSIRPCSFRTRKIVVVRDLAKRDDDLDPIKKRQFTLQVVSASRDFFRCRLVVRRRAVARCGDICITQVPAHLQPTGCLADSRIRSNEVHGKANLPSCRL